MGKAILAAATGLVCVGILGGMLVAHAYPLWVGEEITLRVVRPIDPRDLFRGEHVILSYDLSRLRLNTPEAATQPTEAESGVEEGDVPATRPTDTAVRVLGDWLEKAQQKIEDEREDYHYRRSRLETELRDRTLYVQLEPGETYRAVSVSDEPVGGKVNLRGRVRTVDDWSWSSKARGYKRHSPILVMDYGLEAYFVPEGKGRAIEDRMRGSQDMRAVVAVAPNGAARLKELLIEGKAALGPRK